MLRLNGYILLRLMTALILLTTPAAEAWLSVPREQVAFQLARRSPLMLTPLLPISLKDLRTAAVPPNALLDFFVFMNMPTFSLTTYPFTMGLLKYFCQRVKQLCIERGTMCIS